MFSKESQPKPSLSTGPRGLDPSFHKSMSLKIPTVASIKASTAWAKTWEHHETWEHPSGDGWDAERWWRIYIPHTSIPFVMKGRFLSSQKKNGMVFEVGEVLHQKDSIRKNHVLKKSHSRRYSYHHWLVVEPPIWKICSSKWVHLPQFSGRK